jgi:carbonic anhydrase
LLPEIDFQYEPSSTSGSNLALVNNGHTVELLLDPDEYKLGKAGQIGGITQAPPERKIVLNDTSYTLSNLHFHLPSEHVLDGTRYAMELHIVHTKLPPRAVVAVLLKLGSENATLKPLFDKMASVKNKEDKGVVSFSGQKLLDILPADKTYIGYKGSLTTPACDFGVTWMVLKTPIEISAAQFGQFKEAIKYGGSDSAVNARVTQIPGYHRVSPPYPKKN